MLSGRSGHPATSSSFELVEVFRAAFREGGKLPSLPSSLRQTMTFLFLASASLCNFHSDHSIPSQRGAEHLEEQPMKRNKAWKKNALVYTVAYTVKEKERATFKIWRSVSSHFFVLPYEIDVLCTRTTTFNPLD